MPYSCVNSSSCWLFPHWQLLSKTGFEASYIYSSLDPAARKINAAKFTTKKVNILIVTDVAVSAKTVMNTISLHVLGRHHLYMYGHV